MSSFRSDRFLRPSVLRSISPTRLETFLRRFKTFLNSRGMEIHSGEQLSEGQFQQLIGILGTPDRNTPIELMDAMHLVSELATPRSMELIFSRISPEQLGFDETAEITPADVALQAWLQNSQVIEAIHAETFLLKPRSFESYQCLSYDIPEIRDLSSDEHQVLELELSNWFQAQRCGRSCKVFVFPEDEGVHLLVRRGDPMRREESLDEDEIASIFYRPLIYDVLMFNRISGELKVHADTNRQRALYCKMVGKHFFGNDSLFPPTTRYTLSPLIDLGPTALSCSDIEEMISVRLTELQLLIGGKHREILVHKARDVFEALEDRQAAFPEKLESIRAKLEIRFADSKRPRSVTICPPNVAIYTRDGDAIVLERWLEQQGFLLERRKNNHAQLAKALAND